MQTGDPRHQPLPDCIHLRFSLIPVITAEYTKNKKITFTGPPELCGVVVGNIFEASFAVRNTPTFPYSDWEITDEDLKDYWSVWLYEKRCSDYIKRVGSSQKFDVEKMELDDVKDPRTIPDPRQFRPDLWNSNMVAEWICSGNQPELVLKDIQYFRRYGMGLSFEFLCTWETQSNIPAMTWVRYADLQQNEAYAEFIRSNWDSKIEKERNWEDMPTVTDKDDGFDVQLPEIGNSYDVEPETIRVQKLMEKERKNAKRSKRKRGRTPTRHSKRGKTPPKDGDGSDAESHNSGSDSKSSSEESSTEEPDEKRTFPDPSVPIPTMLPIFNESSVDPVPRYIVKTFVRRS